VKKLLYATVVVVIVGFAGHALVMRGMEVEAGDENVQARNEELLMAAQNNDEPGVEQALADGADVNAQNENNWSALMKAARNNNANIVRILARERPAEINANLQGNAGETALMLAAQYGNLDLIEALLGVPRINVNIRDRFDSDALTMAVSQMPHDVSIVQALVNAEADTARALVQMDRFYAINVPDQNEQQLRRWNDRLDRIYFVLTGRQHGDA